jgi:hypothetical protein
MFRGLLAAFGMLAASAMMPANTLAAGQAITLEVVRRASLLSSSGRWRDCRRGDDAERGERRGSRVASHLSKTRLNAQE